MKITDELIKRACSPTIFRRGEEYYREGRVHLRKRSDNLINAVVDGEEVYNVQVKLDKSGVTDCICTCPYYETMGAMCKHIVAVLKQRQTEQEENVSFFDVNDKIASGLCAEYSEMRTEKRPLYIKFILYADRKPHGEMSYSMSLQADGAQEEVSGVENFLDCYLRGREFLLDKRTGYNPAETYFYRAQQEIIDILAEAYETRSAENPFYTKAIYRTSFGDKCAARIFPLLDEVDFTLVFDGMTVPGVHIKTENPDIIIDIDAADGEINMSVSEYGCALTRDGGWFLYEDVIYRTSADWRGYFMPVYRALAAENRTQISFKGDNTIAFASEVLPALRGKHGVITRGLDEVIVNENPIFKVYLDTDGRAVSAVVTVNYGSMVIRIPEEKTDNNKIIVRKYAEEAEILEVFSHFTLDNGTYLLSDSAEIYDFLSDDVPYLKIRAEVFTSDRFNALRAENAFSVSASVGYNADVDLLEADFDTELTFEQISGILKAVKLKRAFYRMEDGRFIDLEKDEGAEIFSLLARLDFDEEDLKNRQKKLPKYQAMYLSALENVEHKQSFTEYIEKIKSIEPKIPESLKDIIRPYQYDGIKWLKQLSELNFGGILADDMGLGKTLQVLAFVHGERPDGPTLIITPSALVYNWLNEIERFVPEAKTLIIDGTKQERTELIKTVSEYEFVITSYPILRRDSALYSGVKFKYCFIDEAQYIKNPSTMNAKSVKKISAEHKFAVTGTPIENSLSELWSVFDFVMRGYLFGLTEFKNRYEYPITREEDTFAAEDLKAKIRPFILRRMKSSVLNELPEKIENTMYAELNAEQKKMYSAYLALAKSETAALLSEGGKGRIRILSLLMRLRQICCHPALFDEAYHKESGKLDMLTELVLSGIESGHRILIFSQFTSMLEIIREKLAELKISCFYLDGQTPSYERAELADRFNGGERDVFLISLKAGGTGLNLIGADMVIHYDPWWNPAVTDQASDRAYRIGQTRAVQVIKLAAKGTIEEKIMKLQDSKRMLADDIVRVNSETLSSLSNDEIMSLFE